VIVFHISFSVCSLLVYRKATDFCMLILYTDTLLKAFIRFRKFLLNLWGLSGIQSCNMQKGMIWFLLSLFESVLFLSLALVPWIEIPILYWIRVQSGHPCLVPDFKVNNVKFSSVHMMWDVCHHICPLLCWVTFLVFLKLLQSFNHERMLNFLKDFSSSIEIIMKFCFWFCLCGILHLLIYVYWTMLASLEWNQIDHGVWSF
jgi:hypothetical protein